MPREEDLPPSKGGRLAEETTQETINFGEFTKDIVFNNLQSNQKIDWLITYVNKNNAMYNLIVEDLKERIKKLKNGVS